MLYDKSMTWDNRGQKRRRGRFGSLLVFLLFIIAAYVAWALYRPLPLIQAATASRDYDIQTPASKLVWPTSGQAAVAVSNDILDTSGSQTPAPTASTAKVITALMVLGKKPLIPGQSGPTYTITTDDVARYTAYEAKSGSVLPVQVGEQLSEYQMLQAIMLPSANNIADTLAVWAYGSLGAYAEAANNYLASHGITNTHVGSDASGLTPGTTTTAADLVAIGKLAMQQPVLKQIVAQPSASGFPVVSQIKNVNSLLGKNSIIGIKTGNSDQAGGVFLGAAQHTVDGKNLTIITSVVGLPNLSTALQSSLALIQSAEQNFVTVRAYAAGSTVGTYKTPWGATRSAIIRQNVQLTAWRSSTIKSTVNLNTVTTNTSKNVGTVKITVPAANQSVTLPVDLQSPLPPPTTKWRLLHPY